MQKKPKIALVFDGMSLPPKDGVTYRAYHVIKRLTARDDIDARIYLGDRGWTSKERILAEKFKGWMFPSTWLMKKPRKIADMMIADGIDIIHICNSHSVIPFFGFELAQMTGAWLVCDMHDVDYQLYRSLGKDEALIEESRDMQKTIGDYCDHIFAMSSFDLPHLTEMGIVPEKITYAPNGVDIYEGVVPKGRKKRVLFVGNMFYEPNREAAELIIRDIAPATAVRHPDVEFVFIGRTPDDLFQHKNPFLFFLGEVDDLQEHLLSSMIGVAPLISGSGMKVKMLTYASHALPVLGTPIALMGYEKNDGFIIEDNILDMAERLACLLEHPEDILRRGEAARCYVREGFGWNGILDKITAQYKRISLMTAKKEPLQVDRNGNGVEIDGKHHSLPMFMTEKRFTESVPDYSEALALA